MTADPTAQLLDATTGKALAMDIRSLPRGQRVAYSCGMKVKAKDGETTVEIETIDIIAISFLLTMFLFGLGLVIGTIPANGVTMGVLTTLFGVGCIAAWRGPVRRRQRRRRALA